MRILLSLLPLFEITFGLIVENRVSLAVSWPNFNRAPAARDNFGLYPGRGLPKCPNVENGKQLSFTAVPHINKGEIQPQGRHEAALPNSLDSMNGINEAGESHEHLEAVL